MRKLLFLAMSAAIVLGSSLLPTRVDATIIGATAGVLGAADQLRIAEPARRVCRRYCNDEGYCRERCREVDDDDDYRRRRDRDDDGRHCVRVGPALVCD